MTKFVSESLSEAHLLDEFTCGVAALDGWLVRSAHHAQSMRTARTFVWHRGDRCVVAYFSLAAHLLNRADMPTRAGRGSPDQIPAVMLARLALSTELHSEGLGGELLHDALTRAVATSELAGARLVVVDAINESATKFYRHHGFVSVPGNPSRLVQKMSDIAASIAV